MENLHSLFGQSDEKSTLKFMNLYQIFWGWKVTGCSPFKNWKRQQQLAFCFPSLPLGPFCDKFDGIIDNPVHFSELGERRQSGLSKGPLMLVVTLRCSNSSTRGIHKWRCYNLWNMRTICNAMTKFVVMLGFFHAFCSRQLMQIQQDMQKPDITTKDWPFLCWQGFSDL